MVSNVDRVRCKVAYLIDKLGTGSKCAPGGNQVIYEQDTLALLDVALAHLNSVCAILQLIIRRDCLTWAGMPTQHYANLSGDKTKGLVS